jgi:hypothetical protein
MVAHALRIEYVTLFLIAVLLWFSLWVDYEVVAFYTTV